MTREQQLEAEVQRLTQERDEFKRIGQGFERDSRSFFEQSCRNLERAEKAEATINELSTRNALIVQERDEARAAVAAAQDANDRHASYLRAVSSARPDSHFDDAANVWRASAAKAMEANGWLPPTKAVDLERALASSRERERGLRKFIEEDVLDPKHRDDLLMCLSDPPQNAAIYRLQQRARAALAQAPEERLRKRETEIEMLRVAVEALRRERDAAMIDNPARMELRRVREEWASSRERERALREALRGVQVCEDCWCPVGVGVPYMKSHDDDCDRARAALSQAEDKESK